MAFSMGVYVFGCVVMSLEGCWYVRYKWRVWSSDLKNSWGFVAAAIAPARRSGGSMYYKAQQLLNLHITVLTTLSTAKLNIFYFYGRWRTWDILAQPVLLPDSKTREHGNNRISPMCSMAPRALSTHVIDIVSTVWEEMAWRHAQSLIDANHLRLRESRVTATSDLCHGRLHSISHNHADSQSARNIP